jgi:hypothetical protein
MNDTNIKPDSERIIDWKRTLKIMTRISWFFAFIAIVINAIIMIYAGIILSLIGTLVCLGVGILVVQSLRTNHIKKYGPPPQ